MNTPRTTTRPARVMRARTVRRLDRHVDHTSVRYRPSQTIFAQGDRCASVMYIRKGRVSLTVASQDGREALVGVLNAGAFFGEGALAGQRLRRATAKAITPSTIAVVKTSEMRRGLHEQTALSDWFRTHMLARNTRIEEDLVGQPFNRCEKRLARMLLLLAISTSITRSARRWRGFRGTFWPICSGRRARRLTG